MNKMSLIVTADENDADYVTKETDINQEDINRFRPLIKKIIENEKMKGWSRSKDARNEDNTLKEEAKPWFNFCNWPTQDCVRDKDIYEIYSDFDRDLVEQFDERFVPWREYGVHTIKSIRLIEYRELEI